MKKVLSIIFDVLAWVLLIFAVLITVLVFGSAKNNGVPTLLGYMPLSVQSDSMSPTFKQGDLILVKKVDDLYSLKEGDVISYYTIIQGQRVINTHRISEVKETDDTKTFITKGDNNVVDDEDPVTPSDILGKWTNKKIPGLGKFFGFITTKTGFFVCVLIPIAIFFIFELYKFIAVLIETRQIKLSEEDEEEIKRKAVEEYLKGKEEEAKAETVEKTEEATVEEVAEASEAATEAVEEGETAEK